MIDQLKAIAETTRLRIIALLRHGELTVSELMEILGQSQPRISRHMKLLCEAGITERYQEGSWVFFRLKPLSLISAILERLPHDDDSIRKDQLQLEQVKDSQFSRATKFFQQNANTWDQTRASFLPEQQIESNLRSLIGSRTYSVHLDLGCGTGKMLQLFAEISESSLGIDNNRQMLAVARMNIIRWKLIQCQARLGDLYALTLPQDYADLVTLHHVLHYLDNPPGAIKEAHRVLKPNGEILLVDFVPHDNESFRTLLAHRCLGFALDEVSGWLEDSGLELSSSYSILPDIDEQTSFSPVGVCFWHARKSS